MTATAYGTARKGEGPGIPEVEDDLYAAMIKDVKDGTGEWDGQSYSQYILTWEFEELVDAKGEPVTLLSYLRIPDGLINDGVVNENSKLYEFLRALGYDDDELNVDPADWQGRRARIVVENKEIKSGKNAGQVRPRITGYKPPKKAVAAAKPAATTRRKRDEDDGSF